MKILALAPGNAIERENVGAVADFLHRRKAQIVTQLGMASQDNGQTSPAAVVFDQFEQSLQTGQGMAIGSWASSTNRATERLLFFTRSYSSRFRFSIWVGMRTCFWVERS